MYLGFRKKLDVLAKQKNSELVGKWGKSIVNRMYWSVASTPTGNSDLIKAKWLSLVNHVHNIHSGHGEDFPSCAHEKDPKYNQNKMWLKKH